MHQIIQEWGSYEAEPHKSTTIIDRREQFYSWIFTQEIDFIREVWQKFNQLSLS